MSINIEGRNALMHDRSSAPIFLEKIYELEAEIRDEEAYKDRQHHGRANGKSETYWWYSYTIETSTKRLEALDRDLRRFKFYYNTALGRPLSKTIDIEIIKQIDPETILGKPEWRTSKAMLFLCPYHEESRASFYWYIAQQHGYCFGCNRKPADIIDIYQHIRKVDFITACKELQGCA